MSMYSSNLRKAQEQLDELMLPWQQHERELAGWCGLHLLNRDDAYARWDTEKQEFLCVKEQVTLKTLRRHFFGLDVIGLYTTCPLHDNCKWLCIDIDAHQQEHYPNWQFAYHILEKLRPFQSFIEDSNGGYGFHIWTLFAEPVPARTLRHFGLELVKDKAIWGVTDVEVFPKQDSVHGRYGFLVRVPGRHHKRQHVSTFFDGKRWHRGQDAVQFLLNAPLNDASLVPAPPLEVTTPRKSAEKQQENLLQELYGIVPSIRPGDDYNRKANWPDLLEPHGWRIRREGSVTYWTKPDGRGHHATTGYGEGDCLYVFSTAVTGFEAGQSYSKFAAYAILNCDGDYRRAAQELRDQGYGNEGALSK